jgi:hypothetical protein
MYLSTKVLESYVETKANVEKSDEKKAGKKAKSIICMCLADTIVGSVIKQSTAYEVWQYIRES